MTETKTRSQTVDTQDEADAFFDVFRQMAATGINTTVTLREYYDIVSKPDINGRPHRWLRKIDMTSTADPYLAGMRKRVLPALGHIVITMISSGRIDKTIDDWETKYGKSTVKNTVAALNLLLEEARRDGITTGNAAQDRSKRHGKKNEVVAQGSYRALAIESPQLLLRLVERCSRVHQAYGDYVLLLATLALRSSEAAGLKAGDVLEDGGSYFVHVRRQRYPGRGGIVEKQTKGRASRVVPVTSVLLPHLQRMTAGKKPDEYILRGPKGGTLTTATVRDALNWDSIVKELGMDGLVRHHLRHTGATWFADAKVPLHVLQEILGHESINTTRGYIHPAYSHLKAAGESLGTYLDSQGWSNDSQTAPPQLQLLTGGKSH